MDEIKKTGDRIAKVIARAGLASRRGAEKMILDGRVTVNGMVISTPAGNVVVLKIRSALSDKVTFLSNRMVLVVVDVRVARVVKKPT